MMDRDDVLNLLAIIASVDRRTVGEVEAEEWLRLIGKYDESDCLEAVEAHRREQPGVWLEPGHVVQRVRAMRRDRYERADPDIRDTPYYDLGGRALPPDHPLASGRYVDPDGGYIDEHGIRRDRYGAIDKSAPELEYPDGWTTDQRLDATWKHVRESAAPEYAGLKVRPATAEARDAAMRQIAKTLGTLPDDDDDDLPRINALMVPCPFCKASKGSPCRTPEGDKLRRSPGHPKRITAAAVAAGYSQERAERISDEIFTKVMRKYRADIPRANTSWTPEPLGCPDCGSLKRCEHDNQPVPEALYRFNRTDPRFPDSDTKDRAYRRAMAAAGLDVDLAP